MIQGKRVLAIIPARAGSKRLPGKNLLLLAGKPLIAWTIEAAKRSKYIDRIVISSEDDQILSVAKKFGADVPFRRPDYLATDDATTIDVLKHAIQHLPGYDYVAILQPTSPLRTSEDIDRCLELSLQSSSGVCVSVVADPKPLNWRKRISTTGELLPILELESLNFDTYIPNGAVYTLPVDLIFETKTPFAKAAAYIMPHNLSIDVDNAHELALCEQVLQKLLTTFGPHVLPR